jgi:hypothetical protein
MADEIVVKYGADVTKLEKALHGIESEMKDVQKASVSTGNTIQKEANESAKALNKVEKSTRGLKDSFQNLSNHLPFAGAIQQVQDLGQAFTGVTTSVGKTTGTLNILKVAFASLGLGFIITAFASLATYFTSTEKGGDRLAKILSVLGATFGEVTKAIATVGEFLFDTGEAIIDYISVSEKATIVTDDYRKSITELASEVSDLEDELGALSITLDIQNAKLQTAVDVNLKSLRNRNNTLAQTNDIIFDIAKAETEKLQNSNKLIDKEIALERKKFLLKTGNFDNETKEILQIEKLRDELLNKERSFREDIQLENANARIAEGRGIIDAAIAQNKAKGILFDQFIKGEIDAEKLLDNARGTFVEADARRIAALLIKKEEAIRASLALGEKLDNFEATAQAKEEARILASTKKITEIKRQAHVADINIARKTEIEPTKITKEESAKRHAIRVAEMKKFSKEVLQPIIDDSKASEEKQTAKLIEEQAKRKAIRQEGVSQAIGLTTELLNGLNNLQLARETAEIESQRSTNEEKLANDLENIDKRLEHGFISEEQANAKRAQLQKKAAKQESELKKKQFEAEQKAAINRINISTAEAVAKTLATYGFTPLAAVGIAGAIASGEIQKALVRAQPVPKFKDGVIDLQGKGTGTSDSIHSMLSKGESVMTARETKEYKPLFESIRKGYFDKFADENFVKPALKKEYEKNKLREDRDKMTHEYMRSLSMNGLLDTSHLERLTKKNNKVQIGNYKELASEIGKNITPKSNRGL